jgi:predicted ATP-grasp superfamily ATP-dependent carboligase
MFTGALENRPGLVAAVSRRRFLWGAGPAAIEQVRTPRTLGGLLTAAGLPYPDVRQAGEPVPPGERWLIKPLAGAAGQGIHEPGGSLTVPAHHYAQKFVDGTCCSGLFVGRETGALFLGASLQLAGTSWLHAAPFHYAGNVGPLPLSAESREAFQRLGDALAARGGLRGIFGVDCLLAEGVPWTIEVNPRYTASVEVWEYATRRPVLTLHREAFESERSGKERPEIGQSPGTCVGKAIYYAKQAVTIPRQVPWAVPTLEQIREFVVPPFADLPSPGDRIEAGHPVLTILVQSTSVEDCLRKLQSRAGELDRLLGV